MWVIWFGPVVVVFFLAGMTVAAVLLRLGKLRSPRSALAAASLPFGCAALPVLALAVLSLAASALAPDDRVLYAELMGPGPVPDRDRMLFEDFGQGRDREVLLRLDATPAERGRLMALPGLAPATMTPAAFAKRGARRGLGSWWMSPSPAATTPATARSSFTDCLSPAIYAADGYNGWHELRIAFCADDRTGRAAVFVAARRR
ncbi:hypothetical protein [Novosphingobium sp. AP12]|uniref:hypothetical protein n=1 Tax=Novosphingobium sp. AP12 TaxID=1144305 RepID=UPI0002721EC1|nr:hypothetical protein [Novosphingobium sp. AP12]EJL30058.1 hypothetical protein PMI02_02116 [Novosphingobium sp. AP12]